jgi:hypothetical protein
MNHDASLDVRESRKVASIARKDRGSAVPNVPAKTIASTASEQPPNETLAGA